MVLLVSLVTALSGLRTAQASLTTVSHNIANVNTPGYVRKTPQQVSIALEGLGAGVTIAEIRREVNEGLLRDLRLVVSTLFERRTREDYLTRIEPLFGRPGDDGSLGSMLAKLRSTLQALATTPENAALQGEVQRLGQQLALRLNDLSRAVQAERLNADQEISRAVALVNEQSKQIAELNRQIMTGLVAGLDVTDLEDQRDRAVLAIAEQMQVNVFRRPEGSLLVSTADGRTLVDGAIPHYLSYTAQATVTAGTVFNPIMLDGVDLTGLFGSGRLAALVRQRDQSLPARTAELNRLALELFNQLTSANLTTTDIAATPAVNEANRFFAGVDPAAPDNAATIQLHPDLGADPAPLGNLDAARDLAAAMSNEAIVFAAAGELPTMTAGFVGYGNALLSRLAGEIAAVSADREYHENLQQAVAAKIADSSGVNLDEELAKMVELQKAYAAAARVMQAATEMLDVLAAIGR
jgi:flagellar hook-associated protein 1 FlgK